MVSERTPVFLPSGDRAIVVEFGSEIDPGLNAQVHRATAAIERAQLDGVVELVPTYRSLMVHYNPSLTHPDDLQNAILSLNLSEMAESGGQRIVEIPTLYGGEFGPDIGFVAENAGMSESDVIEIHSGADYLVYAMGFSPGFPYLGGLDPRLNTPRLTTPRTLIPGGSVGIAETQTGAYPVASPGGWQLIGRTPLKLFEPESDPPAIINAGDLVRFIALADEDAFLEIERRVRDGSYSVATRQV